MSSFSGGQRAFEDAAILGRGLALGEDQPLGRG